MPKATRVSVSIPCPDFLAFEADPKPSEGHPLVSIALFSCIGLLVSLIAMLMGVQGAWY